MVIKPSFRKRRVVFGGVQQLAGRKFNQVQFACLFVVPVHEQRALTVVPRVVADVLLDGQPSVACELHPRVLLPQCVNRHLAHAEQIRAILKVLNRRLPEQIQQVHPSERDFAHPAVRAAVPEDAVARCTILEFIPAAPVVNFIEPGALQNHGNDFAQHLRGLFVTPLPRQNRRNRHIVHEVGVLVHQAVEQPCGMRVNRRFRRAALHPIVPQAVPFLVADDPLFQHALAALVFEQQPEALRNGGIVNTFHGFCGLPRFIGKR